MFIEINEQTSIPSLQNIGRQFCIIIIIIIIIY